MNEYTTKFKTLVACAGWEPNAALGRYKDGPSHEVKSLEETTVAANTAYCNMLTLLTHNKFNKKDHCPLPKTFVPHHLPGQFGHNAAAASGPALWKLMPCV